MAIADHCYRAHLIWEGNRGHGTSGYQSYERTFRAVAAGKPSVVGSADPLFRGDGHLLNPEDLFLMAIAACHMLTYLALCARRGIVVVAYEDNPSGTMRVEGIGGQFTQIVLAPVVRLANGDHLAPAIALHDDAHRECFLANSCRTPIQVQAEVHV